MTMPAPECPERIVRANVVVGLGPATQDFAVASSVVHSGQGMACSVKSLY